MSADYRPQLAEDRQPDDGKMKVPRQLRSYERQLAAITGIEVLIAKLLMICVYMYNIQCPGVLHTATVSRSDKYVRYELCTLGRVRLKHISRPSLSYASDPSSSPALASMCLTVT